MSGRMLIRLTLILVLILGGMYLKSVQSARAVHEQIVTAKHIKKAPTGLDNTVWQSGRVRHV